MQKHFNKNFIMSEREEEEEFQSSSTAGFVKNSLMMTIKK